jgi:hypothetical protein
MGLAAEKRRQQLAMSFCNLPCKNKNHQELNLGTDDCIFQVKQQLQQQCTASNLSNEKYENIILSLTEAS